ncbi:MAG: tetratricopeptide repeat protein [Myxococcaceae bacterium]
MFVALLALALSAQPVSSVAPSRESAARFRSLFVKGERLYLKGDLGGAIWNFKLADAIKPTPEIAFDLARAYQKLGEPAYSTYYYRLYLRRSPGAEDALSVAELIGEALGRAEVSGRGFLELDSKWPGVLTVDDRRFDESPVAVFLSPGEHVITAEYESGTVRKTVVILTGKTVSVVLAPPAVAASVEQSRAKGSDQSSARPTGAVEPAPSASGVVSDSARASGARLIGDPLASISGARSLSDDGSSSLSAPEPALPQVRYSSSDPRKVLHSSSIVASAVGGGALVVGMALGLIARGQEANYRAARTALTRSEAEGALSALNSNGQAANVLMAGGGALLAVGTVTFVFTLPQPGEP